MFQMVVYSDITREAYNYKLQYNAFLFLFFLYHLLLKREQTSNSGQISPRIVNERMMSHSFLKINTTPTLVSQKTQIYFLF